MWSGKETRTMHADRIPLHRFFQFVFVILFSITMVRSCLAADGASMTATYLHNALNLVLPYHVQRAGEGELIVEILSPEDAVLGIARRNVVAPAGDGVWKQEIATIEPMP